MPNPNVPAADETVLRNQLAAVLEPLLQWFEYAHLKPEMQTISRPFHDLAYELVRNLPRNPERSVALRKLIEAKDCAVRASISR